MTNKQAVNWLINVRADIGKAEYRGLWHYEQALAEIIELLSAEPEIVRCKDCKYQDKGSNEVESWNLCGYRPWLYVPTDDEHYCGYAERISE